MRNLLTFYLQSLVILYDSFHPIKNELLAEIHYLQCDGKGKQRYCFFNSKMKKLIHEDFSPNCDEIESKTLQYIQ